MIELVFTACMYASPSACEERSLIYTDLTPMTCVLAAQPQLAEWAQTHPQWQIARWSCRPMVQGSRDI